MVMTIISILCRDRKNKYIYMLNHSLREDLNMEIESEDLIGRGSEFQSEQGLGTNEFRCEFV